MPRSSVVTKLLAPRLALAGALALSAFILTADAGQRPAHAAAGEAWIVEDLTGRVMVASPQGDYQGWQPVSVGAAINERDMILTGPGAAATLSHDGDVVRIEERTSVTVAKLARGGMTRLLQHSGELSVSVEPGRERKFDVETPYLVATVKGTVFTVTVDPQGAAVDVSHGVVGVADRNGGGQADVSAGETGRVRADQRGAVSVEKSAVASSAVARQAPAAAAAEDDGKGKALGKAADSEDGAGASKDGKGGGESADRSAKSEKTERSETSAEGKSDKSGKSGSSKSSGSSGKGKGDKSKGDKGKGDKGKGSKGKGDKGGKGSHGGKGKGDKGGKGSHGGGHGGHGGDHDD